MGDEPLLVFPLTVFSSLSLSCLLYVCWNFCFFPPFLRRFPTCLSGLLQSRHPPGSSNCPFQRVIPFISLLPFHSHRLWPSVSLIILPLPSLPFSWSSSVFPASWLGTRGTIKTASKSSRSLQPQGHKPEETKPGLKIHYGLYTYVSVYRTTAPRRRLNKGEIRRKPTVRIFYFFPFWLSWNRGLHRYFLMLLPSGM